MKNNIKNIDWIDVNLFPNGTIQNKNIRYGFNIFANYDWFGVESYKMLGCCISLSETIKQIEKHPTDQFTIRWEIYQEKANQELKAYEDLLNELIHKCKGLTEIDNRINEVFGYRANNIIARPYKINWKEETIDIVYKIIGLRKKKDSTEYFKDLELSYTEIMTDYIRDYIRNPILHNSNYDAY